MRAFTPVFAGYAEWCAATRDRSRLGVWPVPVFERTCDVERSRISGAPLRKGSALHRVREKHQGLDPHTAARGGKRHQRPKQETSYAIALPARGRACPRATTSEAGREGVPPQTLG